MLVMSCSGMKEASSQIIICAEKPRSRFSLAGKAMISLLLSNWIVVLVALVTRGFNGLVEMRLDMRLNIIMLCLRLGDVMSMVTCLLLIANFMAFKAIVVVFPLWRPIHATSRLLSSCRSLA